MRSPTTEIDYRLSETVEILVTSEAGDKIAVKENRAFATARTTAPIIVIDRISSSRRLPELASSFTESSAFVLAHLDDEAASRGDGEDLRRVRRQLLADPNANRADRFLGGGQVLLRRRQPMTRTSSTSASRRTWTASAPRLSRHQGRPSTCCR